MKFTVSQKELSAALAAVARVVPSNPIDPTLAAVLLEVPEPAESGSNSATLVRVSAGDGEDWVRTSVAVTNAEGSGSVAVSCRLAADLVKDLPAGDLDCEVADGVLRLVFPGGSYSFPVFANVAFALPAVPDAAFAVPGAALSDAFARVSPAAGANDATPVLTCIRLELSEESVSLTATDRYRLSTVALPLLAKREGDPVGVNVSVPRFATVARLFAKAPEVSVALSDSLAVFSSGGTDIFVRLVGGEYPAWQRLVSGVSPTAWFTLNAAELLAPVRRAARVSSDVVTLSFTPDSLEVSGAEASRGSGSEVLGVSSEEAEESLLMRFASDYLIDGLASFASRDVRLGVSAPERPLLVLDDAGATHMVMPRR